MPPLRTLVALCVTLTACRPGYRHKLSGELQQALAAGPADRKLRVLVDLTARAIKALARRPDVAAIDIESVPQATVLAARTADPRGPPGAPWWAVRAVGADRAWRRRLTGRGVVVGIIDAGASAAHEQLRGNYRGGDDSWHDPTGQSAAPVDGAEGHGTSVLSAAVAQNVAGKRIGVAPEIGRAHV